MDQTPLNLGREAFAAARTAEREAARRARQAARIHAAAVLDQARAGFAEVAEQLYASGALAAGSDSETLEETAERILAFTTALEPLFAGLQVARDVAFHRGPLLTRARSRFDAGELGIVVAEAIAEATLCEPAAAVLTAAARRLAA